MQPMKKNENYERIRKKKTESKWKLYKKKNSAVARDGDGGDPDQPSRGEETMQPMKIKKSVGEGCNNEINGNYGGWRILKKKKLFDPGGVGGGGFYQWKKC